MPADPAGAAWKEVECLRLSVIVDNQTDILSEPPECCQGAACTATTERTRAAAAIRSGAADCIDFRQLLTPAHGLSILLAAQPAGGGPARTILFDAGPERQLWRINARRLGLDAGDIEAVVLSHWHMDHSTGLPEVAAMIAEARADRPSPARPPAVFDLHPSRPARRGALAPSGAAVAFNADPQLEELAVEGATAVELHAEPHTLCGGCFYVSGHIPRETEYEQGNPGNASQWEEGGPWQPDAEVADERFVAVRVRGLAGPVVLSACSHAGIVNVMRAAAAAGGGGAPHAVFGDCAGRIAATVADIAAMQPQLVVCGHCTGWRAQQALQQALPGRCFPGSVGHTYEFRAPPAAAGEVAAGGGGGS